jgi:biotin transport system substrate-specific component
MSKNILTILISVAFMALMAQLTLVLPGNLGGIPITGQSLAVLVVGLLFPIEIGAAAVFIYVLLGALGLPVYADGGSGWEALKGGSGGFLVGFILAALVMGWLHRLDWHKSFLKALLAMIIGTTVLLACGITRLSMLYGFEKALEYGFYPFWKGAVVKILLGALLIRLAVWLRSGEETLAG